MSGEGPFRRDATVERRVACASPEDFLVLRTALAGVGLGAFGFGCALAVTTFIEALVTREPLAFVATLLLGMAALHARKYERVEAVRTTKRQRAAPSHCAFYADGCVLEGEFGRSASRFEAIRAIGVIDGWVIVLLEEGLVVMRNEPDLPQWIAERAPQASRTLPNWAAPRRALLALALVYPVAVTLALLALA